MMANVTPTRERIGKLDIAITVIACLLAAAYAIQNVVNDKYDESPLTVAPFVLITVPLLWRRSAPLYALAATWGALLLHVALFGEVVRCGIVFPLLLILVFSAGSRLEGRDSFFGLLIALAIGTTVGLSDGPEGAPIDTMIFIGPMTAIVWGVGRLVRSAGRMSRKLEKRNAELRQARDERARLEVATDRARLSAELDELLQRRLGELAQLAEAGSEQTDAEGAAAALAAIERDSRQTLEEMRAVVGVLRSDDGDAPVTPQPTLTHLEALVIRAKGAGAKLAIEGSPRALPAGVELSAYRVVEQLLDALDDAPGVEVTVRFADDALELRVEGPIRRRGEQAIERARERVKMHSGTLSATTQDGHAEAVASLPIFATV